MVSRNAFAKAMLEKGEDDDTIIEALKKGDPKQDLKPVAGKTEEDRHRFARLTLSKAKRN